MLSAIVYFQNILKPHSWTNNTNSSTMFYTFQTNLHWCECVKVWYRCKLKSSLTRLGYFWKALTKVAQTFDNDGSYFYVKTAVATFWAPHEKIWLLFIPTSGHTANINNIELLFKVPFATSKTLLRHYKTIRKFQLMVILGIVVNYDRSPTIRMTLMNVAFY